MTVLPKAHDYTRVIVTAMKDEAPYMLEWLSYHMAIGFTHFVILTNDCSDGTDKIARHFEKQGIVTHLNNKAPHPKGIQKTGYARSERLDAIKQAQWLLALDVDEYFRIDIGNGTIDDLIEAIGENVIAVSLMWEMFGNNGVSKIEDQFVTEQFVRASSPRQANPYQIRGLKTLFKAEHFERIGTHCPLDLKADTPPDLHWIDGDGVPLPEMRVDQKWLAFNDGQNFGITLGRINHYAIRSLDAYFFKMHRGFVNRTNAGVRGDGSALEYWGMFNWNISENNKIARMNELHRTMFDLLMQDAKIARLHQQGFDYHIDKIAQLRQSEDWINEVEDELPVQNNEGEIDLNSFINPVPTWEFPISKFKQAKRFSILDPKYFTHLDAS